jgi:two-component system sensor histidine kinase PilS (NtrC family)
MFDGKVIQDVFPWLRYPIERLSEGQDVMRDESILVTGRQRTYLGWTLSPLRDSNRERIGYTFLFQDITRVRELEHTMRRSEKMAALGELSAAIAHEVRNPLAAISGSVQMLESSQSASDKDRRLMRIVLRETEHLNRWITDFLSYARPVPVELRPVDLVALVSDVVESARVDPSLVGARIAFERVDPVYIRADVTRVRQVLWNLVINAQQAIARKGDGQVTLSVHTNIATTRPEVTLRVEDEGDGIAPEHLDRIFQPFFTTRERGTGLGLAVVHRIVEENDGRISVDSEVGRGTTFSIVFPLAMEPAA